jgi:hypothetical protein
MKDSELITIVWKFRTDKDNDYEFFSPVIDKITEIREEFGI